MTATITDADRKAAHRIEYEALCIPFENDEEDRVAQIIADERESYINDIMSEHAKFSEIKAAAMELKVGVDLIRKVHICECLECESVWAGINTIIIQLEKAQT